MPYVVLQGICWSLSVITSLLITIHVVFVLSFHLFNRCILKKRESQLDSEIFRTIFGWISTLYCWFGLSTLSITGQGVDHASHDRCHWVMRFIVVSEALIQWSLLGFLLSKAKIAHVILSTVGLEPSRLYYPVLITAHLVSLINLIASLVYIRSSVQITRNGVSECVHNTGWVVELCELILLLLQIVLVYIFAHSIQRAVNSYENVKTANSFMVLRSRSEEESQKELHAVIRRNSKWGIVSVVSFFLIDVLHLVIFSFGMNVVFFFNTCVLLLNNYIMVRIMGWQMIYAKYLRKLRFQDLLCGICQQMGCFKTYHKNASSLDTLDAIHRPTSSITPTLRTQATLDSHPIIKEDSTYPITKEDSTYPISKEDSNYILMVETTPSVQS